MAENVSMRKVGGSPKTPADTFNAHVPGRAGTSNRDREVQIEPHRKNEGEMFVSAQTFQLD